MQVREEAVRRGSLEGGGVNSSCGEGREGPAPRCWMHPHGVPWKVWLWGGAAGIKRLILHRRRGGLEGG
jgi:hypothetical protein